jgi:hypothetical protein
MPQNSIPISLCRRGYLVFALAVLFAVFASAGSAQGLTNSASERAGAGQTWTITIHAMGLGQKPFYTVSPPASQAKCTDPEIPAPSARMLTVCPGDMIVWKVMTSGSYKLVIYDEDPCLTDASGTIQWFESNASVAVTVDPTATVGDQHKYNVYVYNSSLKRLYVDDPKYIIGGGRSLGRTIHEDIEALKQDVEVLKRDTTALEQDTETLRAKYPDKAEIKRLVDAVGAVEKSVPSEPEDKDEKRRN